MRDTSFSICKAIAIILVVLSHAGGPTWINNFVFQFHVPIFFFCSGYFFKSAYLDTPSVFLAHRFKRLYVPFVKWSLFFLVVHNFFFPLGLLSETFGNTAGGVLHPYTFTDFSQRIWNVVFTMSGYDEFICGAFWFFRALFVSSIAFLLGRLLLRKLRPEGTPGQHNLILIGIIILLTSWKIAQSLSISSIAGGGYREMIGVIFLSLGCLFRQYQTRLTLNWWQTGICAVVTVLGAVFCPSSMTYTSDFLHFFVLLFTATAGFGLVYSLSLHLDHAASLIKRPIIYVGDRTLYIFAFHLLAFKLVSAIKVACYGLPWQAVGSHTVINQHTNDAFWVLYTLIGVLLPLCWLALYRHLAVRYDFSLRSCTAFTLRLLIRIIVIVWLCVKKLVLFIWDTIVGIGEAIRDIIRASSPKDE